MASDIPTSALVLPLHTHSALSLLDAASTIPEYLKHCQDTGLCTCGITDHGYVMGLHQLLTEAPGYGIKPIAGCEFYLQPRPDHVFAGKPYEYFHLTVWAANYEGYQSLITLSSRSWLPGRPVTRYGRKLPRVTFQDLADFNRGLIVGSGCIEGPIGKPLLHGETGEAMKNLGLLREAFKDRLFMELMPHSVDRNFSKEPLVTAELEDGTVLRFKPDDQVLTERGWMTASEALEQQVCEILDSSPRRAQDCPLGEGPLPEGQAAEIASPEDQDDQEAQEPEQS